ncbi:MAG: IS110 family transposase, partial [Pedobacter sp.]
MTNLNNFAGIDVSKEFFDVHFYLQGKPLSQHLPNNPKGFKQLVQKLSIENHCVMEATGPYYLRLACFLVEQGIKVSVVNPLVIKRYSQMRLIRSKTDKADAKMIAEYASQHVLILWEAPKDYMVQLQQLEALTDGYVSSKLALGNQLKSFEVTGKMDAETKRFMKKELRHLDGQLKLLMDKMDSLVKQHFKELYENLTSIPGVGKKTAIGLIVLSNGFTKFKEYRQLSSYVGLCPRVYESGTSIKGKGRICKMGMSRIRKLLYLCSWSAVKTNRACKQMYDRLVG